MQVSRCNIIGLSSSTSRGETAACLSDLFISHVVPPRAAPTRRLREYRGALHDFPADGVPSPAFSWNARRRRGATWPCSMRVAGCVLHDDSLTRKSRTPRRLFHLHGVSRRSLYVCVCVFVLKLRTWDKLDVHAQLGRVSRHLAFSSICSRLQWVALMGFAAGETDEGARLKIARPFRGGGAEGNRRVSLVRKKEKKQKKTKFATRSTWERADQYASRMQPDSCIFASLGAAKGTSTARLECRGPSLSSPSLTEIHTVYSRGVINRLAVHDSSGIPEPSIKSVTPMKTRAR